MPFFVSASLPSSVARLPRLAIAGLPHLVSQRAQHQQPMVRDDEDRMRFVQCLRQAAGERGVAVHAYGLRDDRFDLVVTPVDAPALSRFMQSLSRRHAHDFNRRHGRSGSLWEGRFRAAPLDPSVWLVPCMRYVEQDGLSANGTTSTATALRSSLAHHTGQGTLGWIVDPPAYWALGNTPFERGASYRSLSEQAITSDDLLAIETALRGGWILGSADFGRDVVVDASRAILPRRRGRPRKSVPAY